MTRRVVVTGVGLVCALGIGTEESLGEPRSPAKAALAQLRFLTPLALTARIAGEVKNFDPLLWIEKKELKKMGRFIQVALAAADFAMQDGAPRS